MSDKSIEKELISLLKRKAHYLGKTPKAMDFFFRTQEKIIDHFGSFNEALLRAGLVTEEDLSSQKSVPKISGKKKIPSSSKTSRDALKEKWGKVPDIDEQSRNKSLWRKSKEKEAFKKAEINKNKSVEYTEEFLLALIREKTKELGRTPASTEFPFMSQICRHFGTWSNALQKAGVKSGVAGNKMSRKKIMNRLIEAYEAKGSKPTFKEIGKMANMPTKREVFLYFKATRWADIWKEVEEEIGRRSEKK